MDPSTRTTDGDLGKRVAAIAAVAAVALTAGGLLASQSLTARASGYDWPQFDGNAQHSGNNTMETMITPANVGTLTRLFQVALPATADGPPVYLSGVATANGTQDLLFLTTKDGQILARDAHTGAQLWSHQNGPNGCKINNGSSTCYTTSAPAVDPNRQYVYSYGLDGYTHKYAVGDGTEVTTGGWPETATLKGFNEKGSSDLAVATTGSGAGATSYLYVANGGYPGDGGDYQGHVTTISLNTGAQNVFNANCSNNPVHFVETPGTPDCSAVQTAIWARAAVTYNAQTGRIYMSTGNGDFNPANHDWGDTVFALNPDGAGQNGNPLLTYTPTNYQALQNGDADLGSTAPVILPPPAGSAVQHLGLQSGKDANLRLLNLDTLSGSTGNTGGEIAITAVPQGGEVLTQPAVWTNPADGSTWTFVANGSGLSALKVTLGGGGQPALSTVWKNTSGGTSPVIANNVLYYVGGGGLRALDPTTGKQLWADASINNIHWESPIVANGVLYTTDNSGKLTAYTLPAEATSTPTTASSATATRTTTPSATATSTGVASRTATSSPIPATSTRTTAPSVTATRTATSSATATANTTPMSTATATTASSATATTAPSSTPTNTSTATATNTASATSTSTAASTATTAPASPTPYPTIVIPSATATARPPLTLVVRVHPRIVISYHFLSVRIYTRPGATVSVTFQAPAAPSQPAGHVVVKPGARHSVSTRSRHASVRPIHNAHSSQALPQASRGYTVTHNGVANAQGFYVTYFYVTYKSAKPALALVTATAHTRTRSATRHVYIVVLPPRSHRR